MPRASPDLVRTRGSLIARLKDLEDQESWRDFFNTYWKVIYNFAVKSGLTDAEAQDVVQETVLCVARKMPEFKYDSKVGSFKSWLLHTTEWRIKDQFRKRRIREQSGKRPGDATARTATIERIPDPAPSPNEAVWDREFQQSLLEQAIQRVKALVTARQFQIFDLYVIKNWPAHKVTQALGVSTGQVYLAKHRVAALVRKEVRQLERKII